MIKSNTIIVKVSDKEKAKILKLAAESDMTLSEYIRMRALKIRKVARPTKVKV